MSQSSAKKLLNEILKKDKDVVKVMFYLDKELQKEFKVVCKKNKIKMSELVESLIRNFMKDLGR
jgi:regulator of PEP synthase PpsR (kinase-PPPase family)